MPPKTSSNGSNNTTSRAQTPSKKELEAINAYLASRPDFESLLQKHHPDPNPAPRTSILENDPDPEVRAAFERLKIAQRADMPVLPGDNDSAMKDTLAQGAKDANTAQAERKGGDASKANLGPVMAENLPEPASKEELKKRAEELNK